MLLNQPVNRERLFLAIAGLLQGVATWIVVRIDPHESLERSLYFGLLAWVLSSGLLFQFASSGSKYPRLAAVAMGLGVPFALLTYHVVSQLPPDGSSSEGDSARLGTWCAAVLLALYILLPYVQIYQRSGRLTFPYSDLYLHSWNNFFLAGLGWFYAGIYWALVWICAGLFNAIGIDAVQQLISKPSFIAITTGVVGGLGVALAKEHAQIITTLRSIVSTVFHSLTPLLVVIVLSFLVALPFTGLSALWATKWASSILLALLLLILLFVNAVFQDGEGNRPYGNLVRRGVDAMLLAMPILVGLTLYSMNLRIEQYGLTPERYYAIVFAIVLGGYSAGYAWSASKTATLWLGGIRPFNIAFSFVVLGLAFALHSPLMDPLKRSAEDQEHRLLSGKVDVARFDFGTMRFELGHYGQAVLDRLAQLTAHPEHGQILVQLEKLKKTKSKWQWVSPANMATATPEEMLTKLTIFPSNHTIPTALLSNIQSKSDGYLVSSCTAAHPCDIVAGQWDDDPEQEYVFLNGCGHIGRGCRNYTAALFDQVGATTWREIASISIPGDTAHLPRGAALLAAQEGRLKFSAAQYHCVTVGKEGKECDYWGNKTD
ncbi:MAG: DUF4153 domain-containing protein [Nitrospira sp.]|nr:DUF4153 domain-containing protein [Nitrospira sp.]